MSWIKRQAQKALNTIGLTSQDRQKFVQMFGQFKANKLGLNRNTAVHKGYESNVDVYSVVNRIAGAMSSVPWIIEEQINGHWERVEGTDLNDLMRRPNVPKGYTWEDIIYQTAVYMLVTGDGLMLGMKPDGFKSIEELDVLPSNLTDLKSNNSWLSPEVIYTTIIGGVKLTTTQEEVGHVRLFNPGYSTVNESLRGLSPIQVAHAAVQVSTDRWDANAAMLQNRGSYGVLTNKGGQTLSGPDAEKIQQAVNARIGGKDKSGTVSVTNQDLAFIQLAMSPQDLQLVEQGVIPLRALCNAWGVDSGIFNDPENQSYNNKREANKAFYQDAVIPFNRKIASKLTMWLVPTHFAGRDVRMRPDYSTVDALQEDKLQAETIRTRQSTRLLKEWAEGFKTRNMILTELGHESIENNAEFDRYIFEPSPQTGQEIAPDLKAIIDAQASLRGSVGGVTGIVSVLSSVSEGTITEGAARAILVEIYGFSPEVAAQIVQTGQAPPPSE